MPYSLIHKYIFTLYIPLNKYPLFFTIKDHFSRLFLGHFFYKKGGGGEYIITYYLLKCICYFILLHQDTAFIRSYILIILNTKLMIIVPSGFLFLIVSSNVSNYFKKGFIYIDTLFG